MKKKKFVSTLALTLALLCAFTLGANASGTLQEIKAYLNSGITIKMDGVEQTLKDATGTRIYPISYDGSIYLPIRAVSDMLGVGVDWDGATQSVLLGKQANGVDLIDTYTPYDRRAQDGSVGQVQTAQEKTEDISGVTYTHWIYFETRFNPSTSTIAYNLQGKHNTLTFSYYGYSWDSTLRVLGDDDKVLGEYPITAGKIAQTVTIPLFGTRELRFEVNMPAAFSGVRIFDAYLDAEQ